MDSSALTGDTHHYQHDPNQSQPYDPNQTQSYDPYHAYYNQYPQYYQHQPQPYDYAAASAYPQPQLSYDAQQIPQPQQPYPVQHQAAYPVPAGLNPAAAAAVEALSQLSQFAGSMDAVERSKLDVMPDRGWHGGTGLPEPVGGHPRFGQMGVAPQGAVLVFPEGRIYRGGGRRGGLPSRGGGGKRGNSGHHNFRQISGPSARGRGRGGRTGRGGRRNDQQASGSRPRTAALAPGKEPTASVAAPTQTRVSLFPVAWCDICRVDCNSLEILEQHKNGKRHKKTAKRYEEMQSRQKLLAEMEAQGTVETLKGKNGQTELQSGGTEQPEEAANSIEQNQAMQGTEHNSQAANLKNDISETDPKIENTVEPSDGGNVEADPRKRVLSDPPAGKLRLDGPGHPLKRRTAGRSGGGGKKARNLRPLHGRPQDRPKEQSCVCSLCNIVCDTPAVFERHLAGKKHAAKAKRLHGQEVRYGPPAGTYMPPNQPPPYVPGDAPPLFHGYEAPRTAEHVHNHGYHGYPVNSYGHYGYGAEAYGHQQSGQYQQVVSEHQAGYGVPEWQQRVGETAGQQAVVVQPEARNLASKTEIATCMSESQLPTYQNASLGLEPALMTAKTAVSVPLGTVSAADHVVLPLPDATVEEPGGGNKGGGNQDITPQ